MPSWPEKRVHIGSHAKRIDGAAKVTGAAKYSSDVQPEGWLYGMILRSKWPKAKITKINLEPATMMAHERTRSISARAAITNPIPSAIIVNRSRSSETTTSSSTS